MNKSTLRNFAVWARRDLIKRISDRANLLGVYEDKPTKSIQAETEKGFVVNGVTFNYKKEIREAFIKKVGELDYQDAIEEIAYTWFNRIVALRFMEVNGYLVNGKNGEKIYVIGSTIAGKNEPDALTNADKLSFVDKFTVYDYQDANDNNGLYRYILTKQCNDLNKAMPLMFEKIEDYAELLLPDHLLDKGAIIDHLVNDISAKDFNITIKDDDGENASQVEIVGWLYQFYISEKKDEVFASKDQINKGTLPAVTQLFTPDWVVKYMTENSLGKMWVDGHKSSNLKQSMKYFVEEAEQTVEVQAKLDEINKQYAEKKVTDITFIDPCCGSGHILVYAFDLLYKMYLESGYIAKDIPAQILKNNLIGIDVDKRAVQLTSFALTMKALQYDKNFLSKGVYPNVIDMKESNSLSQSEINDFFEVTNISSEDREVVEEVIFKFKDAELYGSLIKDFKFTPERYDVVLKWLENNVDAESKFNFLERLAIDNVKPLLCDLLKEAYILSSKYDIMATNPPYLSPSTNDKLKDFANTFYPDSKTDMFAMFMEVPLVKENGFLAMINMHSWMFLSSYEKLRKKLLESRNIISMLHLGPRAFEEISGEVVQTTTFVICKKVNLTGVFYRLVDIDNATDKEVVFLNRNDNRKYVISNKVFREIPEYAIDYWISKKIVEHFVHTNKLELYGIARQGLATSDNNLFLKLWHEVIYSNINFVTTNCKETLDNVEMWYPYCKGGTYRKWSSINEYVVNYKNDGKDIKHSVMTKYPYLKNPGFVVKNTDTYFQSGISWNDVKGYSFCCRYIPVGYIYDAAGPMYFSKYNDYMLGYFNSNVFKLFTEFICQGLHYSTGHIPKIPCIISDKYKIMVEFLSKNSQKLSKADWDQYETSWDFAKNPLV